MNVQCSDLLKPRGTGHPVEININESYQKVEWEPNNCNSFGETLSLLQFFFKDKRSNAAEQSEKIWKYGICCVWGTRDFFCTQKHSGRGISVRQNTSQREKSSHASKVSLRNYAQRTTSPQRPGFSFLTFWPAGAPHRLDTMSGWLVGVQGDTPLQGPAQNWQRRVEKGSGESRRWSAQWHDENELSALQRVVITISVSQGWHLNPIS